MTPDEKEAEVALALITGSSDGAHGRFSFRGKVISYDVTGRGVPITATLTLRDGPKPVVQTSCTVMTHNELRSTTIRWGIGMVLELERIEAKREA